MTYISDANDRATILADADTFFLNSGYFAASDADEVTNYSSYFGVSKFPAYWSIGQYTSGLIQVYDLVVPLDPVRATTYLCRLGAIAGALLANRDDTRGFPKDPFRGRVMPAWGGESGGPRREVEHRCRHFRTTCLRNDCICASRAGPARPIPTIPRPGDRSGHGSHRNLRGVPARAPSRRRRPACLLRLPVELQKPQMRQRWGMCEDVPCRSWPSTSIQPESLHDEGAR